MDRASQLDSIIWEEQVDDLIEVMNMLEDKIENSHDRVAQEYYDNICDKMYQMSKAVYEAKEFYK